MKTFIKTISLALLLTLLCLSCKESPKSAFDVNFDLIDGTIDLKLSDILEDIRFIPLETSEECLIQFTRRVSSKYIMASNQNEVHIFDRNGKHIKKILNKGNGPQEYNDLAGYAIDDVNNILYYRDYKDDSSKKIKRVNILTGEHLDPIITDHNSIEIVDSRANLWGTGISQMATYSTEVLDTIPAPIITKFNPNNSSFDLYFSHKPLYIRQRMSGNLELYKDEVYFLNLADCDTLFKIDKKGAISPFLTINSQELKESTTKKETRLTMYAKYCDGFIFNKNNSEQKERELRGRIFWIMSTTSEDYLLVDNDGSVKEIRNVLMDPFDYTVDMKEYLKKRINRDPDQYKLSLTDFVFAGEYGYTSMEAFEFIDLVDQIREEGKMEKSKLKILEDIYNQIDEESNPILLVGKIK